MSSTYPSAFGAALQEDQPLPLSPRARRDIALGVGVVAGFFGLFGGWSAMAPLDAATVANGRVIVEGRRQSVQSSGGGVISALPVHEGDHVHAGQMLISLSAEDAQAAERSFASRVIRRQAEVARLTAKERGLAVVAAPAEFAGYDPVDRADARVAMQAAQAELETEHRAEQVRRAVLSARLTQARDQIDGVREQARSNARQQTLNAQELHGLQDLAARGYAPLSRVRALQRSGASLEGDAGVEAAEVARLQAVTGETRLQHVQGASERAEADAEELRAAEADLQALAPQWRAAREQLSRSVIRAPAGGRVLGLSVNTIGGVVAPGQHLLDIVPDQARLVVEARVTPREGAELKIGQPARIRLPGSTPGGVHEVAGRIQSLSVDVLNDERTGEPFFLLDVAADRAAGSGLSQFGRLGEGVQVMVTRRKRSALQYWLEPLVQRMWRSLHEG